MRTWPKKAAGMKNGKGVPYPNSLACKPDLSSVHRIKEKRKSEWWHLLETRVLEACPMASLAESVNSGTVRDHGWAASEE